MQGIFKFLVVLTPASTMSLRSDPLPSYEDIISGTFLKLEKAEKENKKKQFLDKNQDKKEQSSHFGSDFKYKNVQEDGEISEEGELSEISETKPKKRKAPDSNNNNNKKINKTNNNKINSNKINNKNFSSNTTAAMTPFVPRLICRYFMEGICSKGDKCTFSHSVVPNKTPEEARVKDPCKFFIMGSCMKGEACYYSHDLSVVPCKFFHLRGECAAAAKGASCRFSHSPIDMDTLEKLRTAEMERIQEQKLTDISTISEMQSINNPVQLSAPNHTSQTCEETEKSTECPHDYLNPFAFAGSDCEDGEV